MRREGDSQQARESLVPPILKYSGPLLGPSSPVSHSLLAHFSILVLPAKIIQVTEDTGPIIHWLCEVLLPIDSESW